MREARIDTPMRSVGVPQRFLNHASRSEIHAHLGLTAADLVTSIISWVGRPTNGPGAVNFAVRRKSGPAPAGVVSTPSASRPGEPGCCSATTAGRRPRLRGSNSVETD